MRVFLAPALAPVSPLDEPARDAVILDRTLGETMARELAAAGLELLAVSSLEEGEARAREEAEGGVVLLDSVIASRIVVRRFVKAARARSGQVAVVCALPKSPRHRLSQPHRRARRARAPRRRRPGLDRPLLLPPWPRGGDRERRASCPPLQGADPSLSSPRRGAGQARARRRDERELPLQREPLGPRSSREHGGHRGVVVRSLEVGGLPRPRVDRLAGPLRLPVVRGAARGGAEERQLGARRCITRRTSKSPS